MTSFLADLRYALRSLRNAPLFTTIAAASIALAIGANTAVFTLVDQVILRLVPVQDPTRVVQVTMGPGFLGGGMGDGSELSFPMYRDLRDDNRVFSGMFCRFPTDLHVSVAGRTERAAGELVSGSYFPVLGVQAALGRVITQTDDGAPGAHSVAMLSHTYWRNRFAGDPAIVGQTISVNGQPLTVVGIAAPGFSGLDRGAPSQLFVSFSMQPLMTPRWLDPEERRFRWVQGFGRLRDGVTREQAEAGLQPKVRAIVDMEAKSAAFSMASAERQQRFLAMRPVVVSAAHGHSGLRDALTRPLWILMAIAAGVLMIACANVANLLIARGVSRQREIALRLALGASRGRIVQQLCVEGFALATIGGLGGLFVAAWGVGLLIGVYATPGEPLAIAASPDARIVAFTLAVVALTTVLCALVPALQSSRPSLAPSLKEGSGTVLGGGGRLGLRRGLVVAQVALSLLLLIGAGLFVRSLARLLAVDPGFQVDRVVSFSLDLERSGYDMPRAKQFSTDLRSRLQATPGVSDVAYALFGLLEGGGWGMRVTIEGRPGDGVPAMMNSVSSGFFTTMGIPLVAGRDFRDQDATTTRSEGWPYRVAIANELFVKRFLEGRNPLGLHVGLAGHPGAPTPIEIVGVVKDTKYVGIRAETSPQLFVPYLESNDIGNLTAYLRTTRDAGDVMGAVRRLVHEADASLPVFRVRTLETQLEGSLVNERLVATLSAAFAGLATLLAMIGLYGVMAYSVARRTREIGIRIALGAPRAHVAWRILREASLLIGAGLIAGLAAAWWLTRYVEAQLYGVTRGDVWTLALCVAALAVVALLATLVPAGRAARIEPFLALRSE